MYIVMEIQKTNDTLSTIVTKHATLEEAKSKYFTILAAAVHSTMDRHHVTLLNEKGKELYNSGFDHKEVLEDGGTV